MTLILRRVGPTKWWDLRKVGCCRIGLATVVGMFPSAINKVLWLEDYQ